MTKRTPREHLLSEGRRMHHHLWNSLDQGEGGEGGGEEEGEKEGEGGEEEGRRKERKIKENCNLGWQSSSSRNLMQNAEGRDAG